MLSFIPRLVVHKDEIDRIFFPDARLVPRTVVITEGPVERTLAAGEEGDDTEASSTPAVPETYAGTILRLVSQVPGTIVNIPVSVAQMASDIQTIHITSEMALETLRIPYRALQDLPYQVVQLSSGVAREVVDLPFRVVQISSDMAREVADLPHKASHNWGELSWVLSLLLFASILVPGLAFFVPLSPASAGLEENRDFLYGVQTYYQALALYPWIETCNFAIPQAKIPDKARVFALVLGVIIQKLFDALVAESFWWDDRHVFPIPFSIILSGALAFNVVVPILYYMTPNAKWEDFFLVYQVMFIYWVSIILVCCWAVGIYRLEGRTTQQTVVGFLFGPLRFICKIMLASPLTTKLSPRRWIVLNLVIDIIFTRIQISTLPFIDGWLPFLLLFGTEVLTLLWRYYLGIDRLALWWTAMNSLSSRLALQIEGATEEHSFVPCMVLKEFGTSVRDVTAGCFISPIPHISQLSLSVRNSVRNNLKELKSIDFDLRSLTTRTAIMEDCSIEDGTGSIEDGSITLKAGNTTIKEGSAAIEDGSADSPQQGEIDDSMPELCLRKDCTANEPPQQNNTFTLQIPAPREEPLEEDWEQRPLYHIIDAVGSIVISIIVRVGQQLSIALARNLPVAEHLNESFQASDERWMKAQIYSWAFIFLMLGLLASFSRIFFGRLERLQGGRVLTLSRVLTYLYRDSFWFFFYWLVATGVYVCATMIQHFGADFTLQFQWLQCPDSMEWPGCTHEL
jgi:hypothetical protein